MKPASFASMHELCLAHARSDRAFRSMIVQKLEPQHITMMEWLALGVVASGSRVGLSMTNIATALDVTLPQVTALIVGLTNRKLVKQKILSSDHRGRQVIVTLKGKRVLTKLESTTAAGVRSLTQNISKTRLQEYIRTLEQLSDEAS